MGGDSLVAVALGVSVLVGSSTEARGADRPTPIAAAGGCAQVGWSIRGLAVNGGVGDVVMVTVQDLTILCPQVYSPLRSLSLERQIRCQLRR
jgi:hypothetical protein